MRRRQSPTRWLHAAFACAFAAAGACGEDLEVVSPPDASTDAPSSLDARTDTASDDSGTPLTRCAWDAPFDKPIPISQLAGPTASETAITFTSDEETALIVRKEKSPSVPAKVLRASVLPDGGFTTPTVVPIASFNPATNGLVGIALAPSDDRLYLSYFVGDGSAPAYNPEWDIFVASGNASTGFAAPARLSANINTTTSEQSPYIVDDELFFDSDYPPEDGGPRRNSLYAALLDGGKRTRLQNEGDGGLNGPSGRDSHPVLSRDRLTMFYASESATGFFETYVAHRQSSMGRFSVPMLVKELSGPDHELPLHLSKDECRLYFVRDDLTPGARIWVATRKPTLP